MKRPPHALGTKKKEFWSSRFTILFGLAAKLYFKSMYFLYFYSHLCNVILQP